MPSFIDAVLGVVSGKTISSKDHVPACPEFSLEEATLEMRDAEYSILTKLPHLEEHMQATYRSVSAAVGRVEMAAVQSSDGPMNKSNIYIKI